MLWHCAWEPSYSWDVFSKGGDREARANIIRQICEMFSALPLTFCAVPPITHSRQAQAAADLGNGLPQTHLSSSSSWCLGWGCSGWSIMLLNFCDSEILDWNLQNQLLQAHSLELISNLHPGRVTWLQDPKLHVRLEFRNRSRCSSWLLSTWPLPGLAETSSRKW